jgi:hypothetical protein
MGFEPTGVGPQGRPSLTPQLTVYVHTGDCRVNAAAATEWFDGVDTIAFHVDHDHGRVGIERNAPLPEAYQLVHQESGCRCACGTLLDALDVPDADEIVHLDLEHDPDEGLLVADATPLLEVGDDA